MEGSDTNRKDHIAKLRQVDVLTAQGTPVIEAIRSIGVTEVHLLQMASGVWRPEVGPGEAAEGPGD